MSRRKLLRERRQSLGEEIANSVSHGVGLLAAVVAVPFLIVAAVWRGGAAGIVGASIFAATVLVLYTTSTLYHALPESRAKRVFRVLDHGAIFLLIAGTYTPFTLGVLRGAWGWTLFGVIWGLATAGMVFKLFFTGRFRRLSTAVYLAMGWLVVIPGYLVLPSLAPASLFWLIAGATFFTLRFGFINLRAFKHAWVVTTGHYDDPDDPGEVTHFQALSSALSATVGLGNIAGVAVAVVMGGLGWLLRTPMVTGRLQVEFVRPVPVGTELALVAEVDGIDGRRIQTFSGVSSPNRALATFVRIAARGGDRDRGKRSEMGRVAGDGAASAGTEKLSGLIPALSGSSVKICSPASAQPQIRTSLACCRTIPDPTIFGNRTSAKQQQPNKTEQTDKYLIITDRCSWLETNYLLCQSSSFDHLL